MDAEPHRYCNTATGWKRAAWTDAATVNSYYMQSGRMMSLNYHVIMISKFKVKANCTKTIETILKYPINIERNQTNDQSGRRPPPCSLSLTPPCIAYLFNLMYVLAGYALLSSSFVRLPLTRLVLAYLPVQFYKS